MKRNAMRKNLRQSIFKSFGRYVAISAIIALGAALFVGLLMTKSDMVETGQQFMDEQNMFDLRMVSNYGWTEDYVEAFAKLPGVEDAEGLFYIDLIAKTGDTDADSVYRFYALPEKMNMVALRGGRMPEKDDECLADGFYWDDSMLGQTVTISDTNEEDSLDTVRYKTFTIVGYVATPLYMDMNRGTTSVGSGSLGNYYYVPAEAFDADYFTEINLTLKGDHAIYTDEYNDFLEDSIDALEEEAEALSDRRFQEVLEEVEEEYNEGYQEYLDGVKEYEDGKAEAEEELADAYQELKDAEEELEENRKKLVDAGNEIDDGYQQLDDAEADLWEKHTTCSEQMKEVKAGVAQAEEGVAQIVGASGFQSAAELEGAYASASSGVTAANSAVAAAESALNSAQAAAGAAQGRMDAANAVISSESATEEEKAAAQAEYEAAAAALNTANGQISTAQSALGTAKAAQAEANAALSQISPLYEMYAAANGQLTQAKGYQTQLESGLKQIKDGLHQIKSQRETLDAAYGKLMISWGQWGEGRDEIADGWEEYEEAKLEVEEELAEAEAELKDAEEELRDAREEIDSMDQPNLMILDRNSNVGYNNLDSSSSIVSGVSRVLPVFFLLVASLVCITTMTRMIDEERTQIGTLKALGYTNGEIMSKYLIYSGSGAVLGCSLGIALGCTIFPMIIWQAYCIMLYIQPNMVLTINWALAVAVVLVYTGIMLLVTWYSCHKTLKEEPAELIRPKAPDAGKKILLEYLPFWHKISFLNKVTIRNIFRYRQRMAMMLVGIGGCTALLLTGFGLRDSIINVVDYQFENVTQYDMAVYFRDEIDEADETKFAKIVAGKVEDTMFYHQSSVDLEFDNRTKEIYMISGDSDLKNFIDLHSGDTKLSLPGKNEVLLTTGVAENLGIDVGDRVLLRNADMQEMELTVSGIYDNHVYNYCIVDPDTIETQLGEAPELQMAFVKVKEGQDVHALGAQISDMYNVMNVSVSEDIAEMVGGMMEALDLVVGVIVICAGLLAVIVLYNLTNININERIREIATIKVLGFNASETAAYVFKENLALTVVGSLFGLVLGKLLLAFVMSQIKIDMVWFQALTEQRSYIWSVALTLLSSVVVDFVFYFKLEKINMAEALKSVE